MTRLKSDSLDSMIYISIYELFFHATFIKYLPIVMYFGHLKDDRSDSVICLRYTEA